MANSWLTLKETAERAGVSYPSAQRYKKALGRRAGTTGKGRGTRYGDTAPEVLRGLMPRKGGAVAKAAMKPGPKPGRSKPGPKPGRKAATAAAAAAPSFATGSPRDWSREQFAYILGHLLESGEVSRGRVGGLAGEYDPFARLHSAFTGSGPRAAAAPAKSRATGKRRGRRPARAAAAKPAPRAAAAKPAPRAAAAKSAPAKTVNPGRQLQGIYLGKLRRLTGRKRKQVMNMRAEKGSEAAIKLANQLIK